MKIIKYLSIVVILLVVLVAAVLTTLNVVGLNQYKGVVADQIAKVTGRDFSIQGDSELSVSLRPRILLRDVHMKNAAWGSKKNMLNIGEVELQVALLPLLMNRIEVHKLFIRDLDVVVESNKEQKSNWELGDGEKEKEKTDDTQSGSLQTDIVLDEVLIQNAHVSYNGSADKQSTQLDLDKLGVKHFDNEYQHWDLAAKFNDIPVAITGTTSYLHALLKGQPFKSDLSGKVGSIDLSLNGSVILHKGMDKTGIKVQYNIEAPNLKTVSTLAGTELPDIGPIKASGKVTDSNGLYLVSLNGVAANLKLAADGELSQAMDGTGIDMNLALEASDLEQLGKLAGTELPGVGPVDVKVKLSDIKGGYKISGLKAKVGKSDLNGEATIAYQSKPILVKASLRSSQLDLTPFQKQEPSKKAPAEAKTKAKQEKGGPEATEENSTSNAQQGADETSGVRIFPDTPLPIDRLKTVNIDADFEAKKLDTNAQALRNVKLVLKLDGGRLALKPVQAQVAGGIIEGDVILDASKPKSKPTLAVNFQSKELILGEFKQMQEMVTGGDMSVTIHLKGSGNSVREIMAGLDGEAVIEVGEASLKDDTINLIGGDMLVSLLGALKPVKNDDDKTAALECAVVKFDVQDGDARANKGIALKTKKMILVGNGNIDLKTEKIDFQIRSQNRAAVGVDAGDVTRVVGLGGTLASPAPKVDVGGVAKTGATVGAAVLTLGTSYLAQQLIEATIEDKTPCLTALGKEPQSAENAEEDETEAKAAPEKEKIPSSE